MVRCVLFYIRAEKTAGQRTMSSLIEALIGQTFDLLVILMVKIEWNNII